MNNHRPSSCRCADRLLSIAAAAAMGLALEAGLAAEAQAQVAVEQAGMASATTGPTAKGVKAAGSATAAALGASAAPKAGGAPPPPPAASTVLAAAQLPAAPPPPPPCVTVVTAPAIGLDSGKSTLFRLPAGTTLTLRTLGDEDVVNARMLNPETLYLLGSGVGSTNMILQDDRGVCTIVDVSVGMDAGALQAKLAQLMPGEKSIRVASAADTIVLSGVVSDAVKVEQAVLIANAYVRRALDGGRIGSARGGDGGQAGGSQGAIGRQSVRVVNLLSVAAPQQVLLEVKVAEVSKSLLEKLGASLNLRRVNGDWAYTLLSDFLSGGGGILDVFRKATGEFVTIDAEKKDGLIKLLAEPNLMAISGQEGSFLAGGKVYFPVPQSSTVGGAATITLQEQEFGVGLRFTPTVLEGGRINLRVTPEVSELSPEGVIIQSSTSLGRTIAPLITTRRASTTVQLYDGQSFAIGGLIKNNALTDVKRFPILGEIPVIGALFRSTSFQTDKSELVFVVTPHLIKPMAADYQLPTDSYVEPNRFELFLGGRLEGTPPQAGPGAPVPGPAPNPAPGTAPTPPAGGPSGFEVK